MQRRGKDVPFLFAGTYMLAVTVCTGEGPHLEIEWMRDFSLENALWFR
jgi:hypothetical protein